MKVRNLKANHNNSHLGGEVKKAVLASMKVRNLKANHNHDAEAISYGGAVLASMKVRNLKANHNRYAEYKTACDGCISKYEGTESES